jgi:hypothetical protein
MPRSLPRVRALVTSCAVVAVLVVGGTSGAWAFPVLHHTTSARSKGPGPRRILTGTVRGLGTDSFTITEPDGTSQVIDTTPHTVYSESGTKTAPADVAVGDRVVVFPMGDTWKIWPTPWPTTANATTTTTPVAAWIEIVLARVQGTVSGQSGSTFSVTTSDGLVQVVDTTPATTYTEPGTTVTGVSVGEDVIVYETADTTDPSQLDALFVTIAPATPPTVTSHLGHPQGAGPASGGNTKGHGRNPATTAVTTGAPTGIPTDGAVTAVNGNDFSLVERSGTTITVVVSSTTTYGDPDGTPTETPVAVGDDVAVYGTVDAAGDLVATAITMCGTGPDGWQGQPSGPGHATGSLARSATPPTTSSAPAWSSHSSGFAGPHQTGAPRGFVPAPGSAPTGAGGHFGPNTAGAHNGGSPGTGPGGRGQGQR